MLKAPHCTVFPVGGSRGCRDCPNFVCLVAAWLSSFRIEKAAVGRTVASSWW